MLLLFQSTTDTGGGGGGGETPPVVVDYTTRPSSVFGGGFQNTGCFAPGGVGHQWMAVTGGDVGGFAVSADGTSWRPANTNLLHRNKQRVSGVEGSRTTANRIYAWTSSNDGTGANAGFLLRGAYNPTSGLIDWVTVAALSVGTRAGNAGENHPRQVGRTLALDEGNDVAVVGSIDGLYLISGISGGSATVSQRALTGHHVTGVVLDTTSQNIAYATVDDDGGAGQAGIHRINNIRTGTVTTVRNATFTNPQDLQIAVVGGTRYVWAAAHTQGIWRWTVGTDITVGWTDVTGTLVTTQGYAGIDVLAGAALSSTKVLASTADTATTAVDAGAFSVDGGSTWQRESTSWTVNTTPAGMASAWWLEAAQPSALLNGNTYESECPRINPADPDHFHFHGRSGVWQSLDGGATWWPSVDGQCVSVAIAAAWDPAHTGRVVLGDNDWTMFRSTDRLDAMPDPEVPGGDTTRSVWDLTFRGSGRLAVAAGTSSNTLGEVYTTDDPWTATVAYTSQGFGAAGGGGRAKAVAVGHDGTAEIILAVVEGSGIYRKVGAAAPTLVSSAVTATQTTFPKFCWPIDGTSQYVYCAAATGLYRSPDYGATWTSIWAFTQAYEHVGTIAVDPASPSTLYVTVDDNGSNVGLYKVTNATGTPTITRIGPTADPPGQVAVHPATGQVYLATTMDTSGGPKLWRSPTGTPDASTVFEDLTDNQWAAGVMLPRVLAVAVDGTVVAVNTAGGYFVAELVNTPGGPGGGGGGGGAVGDPGVSSIAGGFFDGQTRPKLQVLAGFGSVLDPGVEYLHLGVGPALGVAKLAGSGAGVNEVDITGRVRSVQISQRGPSSDIDQADPVTCSITVNNFDGAYDPINPLSPYANQLVDGTPFRVRWSWDNTAFDRFYGELSAITHEVANDWDITATLVCTDGLERLGRAYLPMVSEPERDGDRTGTRINYLADQAAWPTALRLVAPGNNLLTNTTLGDSAAELMAKVTGTEFGVLFIDGSGRLVFYDRHHGATNSRSTTVQATFGDPAGTIPLRDIAVTLDRARTFNRVAITRDAQPTAPSIVGDVVFEDAPDEPVEQVADDIASQARGVLAFPGQVGQLSRNDFEVLALAQYLVQRYEATNPYISELNVSTLSTAPDLYGALLGLGPLDRVAVTQDYGAATITIALLIQSVTEDMTADPPSWTLSFTTSPPPPAPTRWTLGSSVLGVGTLGW